MEILKDYAEEINKCSKCGLCQSVCPLYKFTGNDCAVSRGKFVMLDGVIKGNLSLDKTINKYLDMCLKCAKCSNFCPSGIDVCKIFCTAKHEYMKNKPVGKILEFLESEKVFDNFINLIDTFTKQKLPQSKPNAKKTLLYFKGCADKVSPNSQIALYKIIEKLPYNFVSENFKCCGVPFASGGNLERYEEVKKYNTELINCANCDYVITTCASCQSALEGYENLNKKVVNPIEFLEMENVRFSFQSHVHVTFHKPCHMRNYMALKKLFERCENLDYIEMKDYDECCGFAGQFALTNHKLSKELSKNKIKNAIDTNADIILTACPACILGLKQGLLFTTGEKHYPKVMGVTEFLSTAEILF